MILQIKRGTTIIAETANFSYTPSLQEVRQITCEIVTVEKLEFVPYNSKAETTYDTVTYNGNTFILFNAPSGEHRNEAGTYKYSLVFYGKEILLRNLAFLDVVSGSVSSSINQTRYTHGGIFSFFGDHNQLGQRIIANVDTYNASLGSAFSGIGTWTITFDIEGDVLENTISIADGTNLFDALKYFYDTFNLNYYFTTTANGGNIFVTDKKRGVIDWTFKQGDGNGAVSLSSSIDTNTPIVTRIIPQGGSRNMPPDYKKSSLPVDDTRYCPFILLPDVNGNIRYYLDSEYGLKHYGVRGRTIANDFSGIYPTIRGKVLGDLYPGGLPAYDTYLSNGNQDPQSGVVSGTGVSLSTRIDKIIGSSVIKSENDSTFSIYVTSPGFNLGYKVYTEGASGGSINDTYKPSFNLQGNLDYVSFRTGGMDGPSSKTLYTVARYYDQMLNVVGKTTGSFYAKLINHTATDYSGADVSFNLRLSINGNGAGASETITVKYTTENIPLSFDGQTLNGIYTGASGSVFAYIDIEATCPQAQTNEIEVRIYENTASGTINFNNISGIQNDKYYFKYGTASNAIISMKSGLYSGTEFEIDKNGVIPLHGVVDLSRGETEEDAAMFQKGARYKYICRRTEADGTKYPFASTDNSEALAAGSDFILLNLIMPETYVIMAENTLLRASQDYLSRYDHANKTVSINISSGFVAEHPAVFDSFDIGNVMRVRDDAIGIHDIASDGTLSDMELQIQGLEIKYTESSIFPSYSCTVARMKSLSFYERLAKENQTYNSIQTTNISAGSGSGNANNIFSDGLINELIQAWTEFGSFFEFDKAKNAIRAKYALYTNDWLSALGAQSGSSGGGTGGGVVKSIFRFADLGKTFDDNNNDTFTAYTINEIWKLAKDGGGIKTLTVTGAGNAITNLTLSSDGKTITATKDLEFVKKGEIDLAKYVTLDTAQEISGAKTFLADLNPKTTNVTSIGTSALRWKNIFASVMDTVTLNATNVYASTILQVGDVQIKYDTTAKAIYFEHKDGTTPIGIYSLGWISAKGVQTGGGSGGGGLITNLYRYADLGGEFDDNNNDTFTAYTINKIWEAVQAGMGIKTLTVTGSGNAITDMTLSADGRTITATKGTSFASADAFNTLNSKVNDFLTGTDTDNIINKWKELETFLSGMAETDNLATILATKADKTITISAGAGLTGGGNLSANRSFALATSGAKAGTYTKVTVDVYGRVTAGTTLVEADIPNLSWGKITGKPTTLAGYGITDAYTKAETDGKYVTISTDQDINGIKRFTKGLKFGSAASTVISESTTAFNLRVSLGSTTSSILRWNGTTYGNLVISSTGGVMYFRPNGDGNDANQMALNTAGNLSLKGILAANFIQIGDGVIRYDTTAKAIYFEHKDGTTVMGVYSKGWMSALGAQSGSGGGASTTLAGLLDVTITTPANGQALIYDGSKWVNKTIQQGLDTAAMWAALAASDSSKVIDVSHIPNLPWSKITSGKPTTLAGYGITDAYTKTEADNKYVTINTVQSITAKKTFTVQPAFDAAQGLSPFTVASSTVVARLRANYANILDSHGNLTAVTGTVHPPSGVTLNGVYNNGYPVTYGNLLRLNSNGGGSELLLSWYQNNRIFYRSIRDNTDSWLGWVELLHTGNYDSTLGSVYVKKTGDTMTGALTMANAQPIILNQSSATSLQYIRFQGGDNDYGRIGFGATASNAGYLELATADDSNDPIYIRQYSGMFANLTRTATLLDASGNTQFPGTVQANYFTCRNTTLCTNLNADLFDGQHSDYYVKINADILASQYNQYDYIEFLRITIPSGQTRLADYVVFDLTRTEIGAQMSGRAVVRIRRNSDNTASYNFYVTNFGTSYLPEMRMTTDDGITWKLWIKCIKGSYDPYLWIKVVECYTWKNFTIQRNGVTGTPSGSKYNITASVAGISRVAEVLADGSNHTTFVRKAGDTMTGDLNGSGSRFNIGRNISDQSGNIPWYGISFIADTSNPVTLSGYRGVNIRTASGNVIVGQNAHVNVPNGLTISAGYVYNYSGWFQNNISGLGLYNSAQDARWYANGGWWIADKPIQGHYFKSVIATGTAPYQCYSTTINTNLNADMLDGYHQTAFLTGYDDATKYRLSYRGGGTDTTWRWIVRYVNTGGSTHQACTVCGKIWLITGNHSQGEIVEIPFQAIFYAYASSNSMLNQSYLYLPQYCNWDLIRIVRYANNSWELQIRQPYNWSLISTEYSIRNAGGTVTAGQFTSSGIHSTTVTNSYNLNKTTLSNQYVNRADHADRLTTARNFYINSYDNYRAGDATSFNGLSDVTLKLPSSIRCNDWFRSIGSTGWYNDTYGGGIYMTDSNYVRVYNNKHFRVNGLISCGEHQDDAYGYYNCTRGNSTSTAYSCYAMVMVGTRTFGLGYKNTDIVLGSCTTSRTINPWVYIDGGRLQMQGNIYATGAMTAKSSGSDIRLKKDIQSYKAMDIINKFRSVKYHWNDIAKANSEVYNNDYDQFGLIAQDLLSGGYKQWVKDVFKDYYTIEYERLIPVVWKGLQEVDSEVDKLKREVATLKNRIAILEGRKSLSA